MRSRELGACLVLVIALAGCAAPLGRPVFKDPALSVAQAATEVVPGQDTIARVEERLGPAERLRFASGLQVAVWRDAHWQRQGQGDGAELVLLCDPAGRVLKVRTRAAR